MIAALILTGSAAAVAHAQQNVGSLYLGYYYFGSSLAFNPASGDLFAGGSCQLSRVHVADSGVWIWSANSLTQNGTFYCNSQDYSNHYAPAALTVDPTTNRVYFNSGTTNAGIYAIDAASTALLTRIPLPLHSGVSVPRFIGVNPNTNKVYIGTAYGEVLVVDSTTNNILTTITGLGSLAGITVNPVTNLIYVSNEITQTVNVIDGATNTLIASDNTAANATYGTYQMALDLNPVTNKIYANSPTNIGVIDGASNAVVNFSTGSSTQDPAEDSSIAVNPVTNRIYATNDSNGHIGYVAINGADNSHTVGAGTTYVDATINVDPTTNQVYTPAEYQGVLFESDGFTNATIGLGESPALNNPNAQATDPIAHRVYLGTGYSSSVMVVDQATNATTAVPTGSTPTAVAVDPARGTAYIANYGGNSVTVLDSTNHSTVFAIGQGPSAIAINPMTAKAYVTSDSAGTLSVQDASNSIATIKIGNHPNAVAVDTIANRIYAINSTDNTVSVVDGASFSVVRTVAVGNGASHIGVLAATGKVFVTNTTDGTVSVIDGATGTVATVSVGNQPGAIAADPLTHTVWVANAGASSVSVIDGSTGIVSATLSDPSSPVALGYSASSRRLYIANSDGTVSIYNEPSHSLRSTTASLSAGTPLAVAVDVLTQHVYVTFQASGAATLVAIDDQTNNAYTIPMPSSAAGVAVSPAAGKVYVSNPANTTATVVTINNLQNVPLNTTITPVRDSHTVSPATVPAFETNSATPSFTVGVNSAFASLPAYAGVSGAANPPPTAIYYAVDTPHGTWTRVTPAVAGANPATFNVTLPATAVGVHTLYVFASYGSEVGTGSHVEGSGNTPIIGNVVQQLFQIDPLATATSLTSSTAASLSHTNITFTATVAPSAATGSVAFVDAVSGRPPVTLGSTALANGVATLSAPLLGNGTHTVTALYGGDSAYGPSGASLHEAISGPDDTAIQITLTPAATWTNTSSTLTATVTDLQTASTVPSGTVTFYATANGSTTTLGTSPTVNGTSSLTYAQTTAGTYIITASFAPTNTTMFSPAANTTGQTLTVLPASFTAPSTAVGATSSQTVTVYFAAGGTLATTTSAAIQVLTQGIAGLDFAFASSGTCKAGASYTTGQVCTVNVTFAPSAPGLRLGAVRLYSNGATPAVLGTAFLNGTATAPLALFSTPLASNIAGTASATAVTVGPDGAVYYTSQSAGTLTKVLNGTATTLVTGISVATGVALDGAGDLFYGAYGENKVYELVGGTGTPLAVASIANPDIGFGVDAAGNVYVPGNSSVAEIDARTHATTVLTSSVAGLGSVPATTIDPSGNLYFSDFTHNTIYEIASANGVPVGSATAVITSGLSGPRGLAADAAGHLYISNQNNGTLLRAVPSTGFSTTTLLSGPSMNVVALDSSGRIYIAAGGAVSQLSRTSGSLAFANLGNGRFSAPLTAPLENDGNAPLALTGVTASTNFGVASSAGDCTSSSVLTSDGTCAVAILFAPVTTGSLTGTATVTDNSFNNGSSTQTLSLSGTAYATQAQTLVFNAIATPVANGALPVTLSATASSGLPVTFSVTGPASLSGNVLSYTGPGTVVVTAFQGGSTTYAAVSGTQTIIVNAVPLSYTAATTSVGQTSSTQTATVTFLAPATLGAVKVVTGGVTGLDFVAATGGTCTVGTAYVANQACTVNYTFAPGHPGRRSGAVVLYDNSASPVVVATSYLSGIGNAPLLGFPGQPGVPFVSMSYPADAAIDELGNLYVSSGGLYKVHADGTMDSTFQSSVTSVSGVGLDGAGNLFYGSSTGLNELVGLTGSPLLVSSSRPDNALLVDGGGNLYFYDGNLGIQKLAAGTYSASTLVNSSSVGRVIGMALDSNADLYFADFSNSALYKLPAAGSTPTQVGESASLYSPDGLAVDAAGNLYIGNFGGGLYESLSNGSAPFLLGTTDSILFVKADSQGNIFVGDRDTSAIIKFPFATPPASIFASVNVNSTSTQSITLTNNGNQPLTLSAISSPTGDFALNAASTTCSTATPIAVGTACVLNLSFTPSAAGVRTGSLAITDNSNNAAAAVHTLKLSGTGLLASQTITFPQPATPVTNTVGFSTTLMATASSGLPVTYSVVSGSGVVSGSTLTYTGAGSVVISASQTGNVAFTAATSVNRTIVVNLVAQTITFPALATPITAIDGTAIALSATSTSGLPITYTVTGPATVSGSTFTVTGQGSVVITAHQAGSANYSPATSVSQTVQVVLQSQTITFPQPASPVTLLGASPVTLTATASSGLPVTYTVAGPATVSGSMLTYTGTGTVVVTASQAGDARHSAATPVSCTINVTTAAQTINFSPLTPPASISSATPLTLAASASSGLPVTFAVSGPATISGTTLTFTGAGTVVVTASQAGNAIYAAAPNVTQTLVIAPAAIVSGMAPATTVGVTSAVQTATIVFQAGATLNSSAAIYFAALTQGLANGEFKVAPGGTCAAGATYTPASTCTVNYTFTPAVPGLRLGALVLSDNSATPIVVASTPVSGIGQSAAARFNSFAGATYATMSYPADATIDPAGNLYVSAQNESHVLRIPAGGGTPTTVATAPGVGGIALDGAGNLFFGESDGSLYELAAGASSPVAVAQNLNMDNSAVILPTGDLVVQTNGNTIVKLTQPSLTVSTLTTGTLGRVVGMTTDAAGNLFFADFSNNMVYRMNAGTTSLTLLSSGGLLSNPDGIAVDPAGNLYVANFGGSVIRLATGTWAQAQIDSGFSASFAKLDGNGNLYVGDLSNNRVVRYDRNTLAFAYSLTAIGNSSPAQTAILENDGNEPLTLTGVSASTNFGVAAADTCGASTVLTGAQTCTLAAQFVPTVAGSLTGSLSVASNNLAGTAPAPAISLSGVSVSQYITFPQPPSPAYSGADPVTLTAVATSGLPVTYTVLSGPASVSGSILTYTGAGTVVVEADQSGDATHAAAAPVTVTVNVTAPPMYFAAPSMAIGSTSAAQAALLTFAANTTLSSNLATAFQFLTLGAPSLDFRAAPGGTCVAGATYTAGQSCSVHYTFTPVAPGLRSGAVVAVDNTGTALTGSVTYLSGNGLGAQGVSSTTTHNAFATLSHPGRAAVDGAGNLYVISPTDGTIVKVTPAGVNTTLVNGIASAGAITIDGAGTVFYSSAANIYALPSGAATPVLFGTASQTISALTIDGQGKLYMFQTASNHIYSNVYTTSTRSFSAALFRSNLPSATADAKIAPDGTLFWLGYYGAVDKVPSGGPFITVLSSFPGAHSLVTDAAGNIYIAANSGVVRLDNATAGMTTLDTVNGSFVLLDNSGNLLVGDSANNAAVQLGRAMLPGVTFPNTGIGQTSVATRLPYENDGNQPLAFSTLQAPAPFALTTGTTCSTGSPLAAGSSCSFAIVYSPVAQGTQTGTFTATSNSTTPVQTATLTGSALPAQVITFAQPASPITFTNGATVNLVASSSSGLPVTFSVVSGPGTISGSVLTYTAAGTIVLEADQAGNASYAPAPPVQVSVVSNLATPVITWAPSTTSILNGAALGSGILDAQSATTPGTITYTATPQGGSASGIDATSSFAAGGIYTLTATFVPNDTAEFAPATATQTLTVRYQMLWLGFTATYRGITGYNESGLSQITTSKRTRADFLAIANNVYFALDASSRTLNTFSLSPGYTQAITFGSYAGAALAAPVATAMDGNQHLWVVNSGGTVSTFSGNAQPISQGAGFASANLASPAGVAIDSSGNVWVSNAGNNSITEIIGAAAPVSTAAQAVQNNTVGAKP